LVFGLIPIPQSLVFCAVFDKVWQWLVADRWFFPDTSVFSTIKSDHHYIVKIWLRVALNTRTPTTVVTSEAETASKHPLVQHLCSSLVFGLIPIPQSLVFCAVFCGSNLTFFSVVLSRCIVTLCLHLRYVITFNSQMFPIIGVVWNGYLLRQHLSPLKLRVRMLLMARCTTLCDKVWQWLVSGRWFFRVLRFFPPIKLTTTI
jgi:hypothetical protein